MNIQSFECYDEQSNCHQYSKIRTNLLNCRQFQGQSNTEHLKSLRSWADTIEYHGGNMTFAQKAASQPGTNGITHDGVTCFNCQGTGHYANKCPKGEAATSLMHTQFTCFCKQFTTGLIKIGFHLTHNPIFLFLETQKC
jgi:hypothetical protein